MKNTNEIIVAFHVGRGGRFHNSGFTSFIGEKKIGEFTDDLFLSYENQQDIFNKIKGRENLENKYYECCDNNDFSFFEKLGFEIGEKIYTNCNGDPVGLTEEEQQNGVGCINIDNDYDTTYACKLVDCSEEEIKLIYNATGYKSSEIEDFCKEYLTEIGEIETTEEEIED